MTNGWEILRLGDLSERITKGTTPKKFTSSGIKYFKAECLSFSGSINENKFSFIDCSTHEKLKRSMLEEGDILISIAGMNLGKVGVVKKHHLPANTNQAVGIIRLHDKSSVRFLKYALLNPKTRAIINSISGQAAQPNINLTQISNLKISFPRKDLQTKIASILSAYDDLIENNLKRIKLLEEKAQLTYEEWFVRMKYPGHENDEVDSETGLPEGWHKKRISEICDFSGGGTPSKSKSNYWDNGNLTWFAPTDLSKSNSLVQLDSSSKITEMGLRKSSAKLLGADSFMMTSRATVGLFGITNKPFSTNQGFINITPHELFHKEYLLYCFKHHTPLFINYATGSTFLEISKGVFGKIRIPWPCSNIIERYSDYVSQIHSTLFNLSEQNVKLKIARNLLLPRLMSGMIDIDEVKYNYPKEILA